ncbi:unnamed protein product [Pylaiella littoralis]
MNELCRLAFIQVIWFDARGVGSSRSCGWCLLSREEPVDSCKRFTSFSPCTFSTEGCGAGASEWGRIAGETPTFASPGGGADHEPRCSLSLVGDHRGRHLIIVSFDGSPTDKCCVSVHLKRG